MMGRSYVVEGSTNRSGPHGQTSPVENRPPGCPRFHRGTCGDVLGDDGQSLKQALNRDLEQSLLGEHHAGDSSGTRDMQAQDQV